MKTNGHLKPIKESGHKRIGVNGNTRLGLSRPVRPGHKKSQATNQVCGPQKWRQQIKFSVFHRAESENPIEMLL